MLITSGGSQNYTMTANTGFIIDSVTVDGVNQGVISSYDFANVTDNHTIKAFFGDDPNIHDTTVQITAVYESASKDSIIERDTVIDRDTIVTTTVTEIATDSLINKIDSLSDNTIYATVCDTLVTQNTNVYITHDTLCFVNLVPQVLNSDTLLEFKHHTEVTFILDVVDGKGDSLIYGCSDDAGGAVANTYSLYTISFAAPGQYTTILSVSDPDTTVNYNLDVSVLDDSARTQNSTVNTPQTHLELLISPPAINLDKNKTVSFTIIEDAQRTISETMITVYDPLGNCVNRRIFDKREEAHWNLTNNNGRVIGTGIYLAVVQIRDSKGNRYQIRKLFGVK